MYDPLNDLARFFHGCVVISSKAGHEVVSSGKVVGTYDTLPKAIEAARNQTSDAAAPSAATDEPQVTGTE